MIDVKIEKVMDREKIAKSIHTILDVGAEMLRKEKLESVDFGKIKVIRTLGTHMNAAVTMIQQETAQQRTQVIIERMKQLGYGEPKQVS